MVNLFKQLVQSYELFLVLSVRVNIHKYVCPYCKEYKLCKVGNKAYKPILRFVTSVGEH